MRFAPITLALLSTLTLAVASPIKFDEPVKTIDDVDLNDTRALQGHAYAAGRHSVNIHADNARLSKYKYFRSERDNLQNRLKANTEYRDHHIERTKEAARRSSRSDVPDVPDLLNPPHLQAVVDHHYTAAKDFQSSAERDRDHSTTTHAIALDKKDHALDVGKHFETAAISLATSEKKDALADTHTAKAKAAEAAQRVSLGEEAKRVEAAQGLIDMRGHAVAAESLAGMKSGTVLGS